LPQALALAWWWLLTTHPTVLAKVTSRVFSRAPAGSLAPVVLKTAQFPFPCAPQLGNV